jgi:hypothetical protein
VLEQAYGYGMSVNTGVCHVLGPKTTLRLALRHDKRSSIRRQQDTGHARKRKAVLCTNSKWIQIQVYSGHVRGASRAGGSVKQTCLM